MLHKNIRLVMACLWCTGFFSVFLAVTGGTTVPAAVSALFIFAGCLAAAGAVRLLSRYRPLMRINDSMTRFVNENLSDRFFFANVWILILIPWIFVYLALFPGVYGYDVPVQVAQFFGLGDMYLASNNPVAHTVLIGLFLSFGDSVLHSHASGFALYTAFQMLMVTGCAARSLLFLKKRNVPVPVILAGLIWFALNPVVQVLGLNATKDTLFGVFLLHFVMCFWDCLQRTDRGVSQWIGLAVSALLMCLFRNFGIYILPVLLLALLVFRIRGRQLYAALVSAFLIAGIFFAFCTYGLKLEPGDKREMLSVPIQQVAYVCSLYLNGEDVNLTGEQLRAVEEVIRDEGILADYHSDSADLVKSVFDTKVLSQDIMRYWSIYLEIGRQNPGLYWKSTAAMIRPYWNMALNENTGLAIEESFPNLNYFGIKRQGYLAGYYDYLAELIYSRKSFVFPLLSMGLSILVILSGMAIARRDKILFLGRMPIALYVLGMLLGPVALLRYLFPVMLATPLLFGAIFFRREKDTA